MDKRFLEDCLAKGMSLPEIGRVVGRPPSTVGYWVKRHGLVANGSAQFAPKGELAKERLEELLAAGSTVAEIAQLTGRDVSTVYRWLRRYGLKVPANASRKTVLEKARRSRAAEIELACMSHGRTSFARRSNGTYRCRKCASESVARRRKRVKQILVEAAGGHCQLCGYDRCVEALHFHHVAPEEKQFGVAARGMTLSLTAMESEAAKCVLLCANCHAEVERGVTSLPESRDSTSTPVADELRGSDSNRHGTP